jgi:hypothetical protein
MGDILRGWGLDRSACCGEGLRCAADSGPLIVHEAIIDDDRGHNAIALPWFEQADRGRRLDYTGADSRGWMANVGFKDNCVEHLAVLFDGGRHQVGKISAERPRREPVRGARLGPLTSVSDPIEFNGVCKGEPGNVSASRATQAPRILQAATQDQINTSVKSSARPSERHQQAPKRLGDDVRTRMSCDRISPTRNESAPTDGGRFTSSRLDRPPALVRAATAAAQSIRVRSSAKPLSPFAEQHERVPATAHQGTAAVDRVPTAQTGASHHGSRRCPR